MEFNIYTKEAETVTKSLVIEDITPIYKQLESEYIENLIIFNGFTSDYYPENIEKMQKAVDLYRDNQPFIILVSRAQEVYPCVFKEISETEFEVQWFKINTDYSYIDSETVTITLENGVVIDTSDSVYSSFEFDYQDKLVSGDNIKTVNSESILGSGNIDIPRGESGVYIGEEEPTDEDVNVWIDPDAEGLVLPTKTSDLTNDSGFITREDISDIGGPGIPEFSTAKTYKVGDVVKHGDGIFRCAKEVTTPGEWTGFYVEDGIDIILEFYCTVDDKQKLKTWIENYDGFTGVKSGYYRLNFGARMGTQGTLIGHGTEVIALETSQTSQPAVATEMGITCQYSMDFDRGVRFYISGNWEPIKIETQWKDLTLSSNYASGSYLKYRIKDDECQLRGFLSYLNSDASSLSYITVGYIGDSSFPCAEERLHIPLANGSQTNIYMEIPEEDVKNTGGTAFEINFSQTTSSTLYFYINTSWTCHDKYYLEVIDLPFDESMYF